MIKILWESNFQILSTILILNLLRKYKKIKDNEWLVTIIDSNAYILCDYLYSSNKLSYIANDKQVKKLINKLHGWNIK